MVDILLKKKEWWKIFRRSFIFIIIIINIIFGYKMVKQGHYFLSIASSFSVQIFSLLLLCALFLSIQSPSSSPALLFFMLQSPSSVLSSSCRRHYCATVSDSSRHWCYSCCVSLAAAFLPFHHHYQNTASSPPSLSLLLLLSRQHLHPPHLSTAPSSLPWPFAIIFFPQQHRLSPGSSQSPRSLLLSRCHLCFREIQSSSRWISGEQASSQAFCQHLITCRNHFLISNSIPSCHHQQLHLLILRSTASPPSSSPTPAPAVLLRCCALADFCGDCCCRLLRPAQLLLTSGRCHFILHSRKCPFLL